jgi:hypothetical protein
MEMFEELESVVLTRDIPDSGLNEGDVGTVVHRYGNGEGYEVEFVAGEGRTVAVLTLNRADLRPLEDREILHVRKLASA